jgi:hypothetical protein
VIAPLVAARIGQFLDLVLFDPNLPEGAIVPPIDLVRYLIMYVRSCGDLPRMRTPDGNAG